MVAHGRWLISQLAFASLPVLKSHQIGRDVDTGVRLPRVRHRRVTVLRVGSDEDMTWTATQDLPQKTQR